MATFKVSVEKVNKVIDHPDADRLSIVQVLGYNVITKKNEFKEGDLVVYIPTQAVLPDTVIEELNLKGKLAGSKKNRVKEVRLRGVFSEGLIYPHTNGNPIGTDMTEELGIKKYEQPIPPALAGEVANIGLDYAFKFDIENFKNHPDIIQDGEEVVLSEKIHGTCFLAGAVPDSEKDEKLIDSQFFVSSKGMLAKGLSLKDNEANEKNTYIKAAKKYNVLETAKTLANRHNSCVYILGEVFGNGIQDLQYGANQNEVFLRVFAIYLGKGSKKKPLDSEKVDSICEEFDLQRVPVLYEGPFSKDVLFKYTNGKETVSGKSSHIREGVVITPKEERYDRKVGRVILKSISEDYLLRKNATEFN